MAAKRKTKEQRRADDIARLTERLYDIAYGATGCESGTEDLWCALTIPSSLARFFAAVDERIVPRDNDNTPRFGGLTRNQQHHLDDGIEDFAKWIYGWFNLGEQKNEVTK